MAQGRHLSKAQLEHKFEVTIPWLQYLQIQHLLSFYYKHFSQQRPLTNFETLLKLPSEYLKGYIFLLYKILLDSYSTKPPKYVDLWNKEGIVTFTTQQWERIWKS